MEDMKIAEKSKNRVNNLVLKAISFLMFLISIIFIGRRTYAITLIDYNKYIEEGRIYNLGGFDARYNPNVLKYRKYGHFTYDGKIMYPTGDPETQFNEVNGDRILAHQAISTDETYKITGQFDYEGMNYSYYDIEGLNNSERNRYEFQSKIDSLIIKDRKSEDQGYGAYNLRAGKNIVSFINFAYDFYKNQSGEKRVGCENINDLAARGIKSGDICPMEALKGYQDLSHTNVELFDYDIFNVLFKKCSNEWEYQGSKEIAESDKIFANLQYYYMALVYLQPGLKKFKSMRPNDFNSMDYDDNAAFLSMMFERYGGRPIIPENYEARNLVNRLGDIGEYEILPALIEDGLNMSVGERIYRYMIEIKYKNNPEALARWISEYNEIYGKYEILSAEEYDIFKKASDEVYRKYASSRSVDTALDFGYVIDPSKFESKISFDFAVSKMADHLQENFKESSFYKNRNNAEYVAKTYAMVKGMCENEAFTDITDIYACVVNLVEHSYGYDSTEIMLADTQVVHLMANLDEGDYDTDGDNLLDREELNYEEEVNISNLLEEYIKYCKLSEEEANKLRADPYIKMWSYKSNPALPDTDFDGRNDDMDIYRPLENRQVGNMSTLNYGSAKFDYNQDYRYFFMPSTRYYYELSEMSMVLSNMVNKKGGINRRWLKDTNYENRILTDDGEIEKESYRERYNAYSMAEYMHYIGLSDMAEYDMSNTYTDSNVCRYAIGHRDVIYSLGRTQNVMRNVIAISIGDIESKAAELYANFDGHSGKEGSNIEYHHKGFDIVANRIFETVERYASRYAPEYQKVYWITGEGGGGSVANLLAQKMIKKYGNQNIYCYTFQALNTINCNNIPPVQRISNEPYGSIFNLYNDDNQTLQIYTNEANFYMYGARKHVAVSSSKKYMDKWRRATGINYDTTPDKEYAQNFIKMLTDKLDREMVSGFRFTEIQIKTIDDYIRKISETNNPKDFENLHIDLVAYFVKIGLKLEGEEFKFEDPNDNKKFKETMAKVEKWRYINFVDSSMSSAGVNGATDGINIDIANNFGVNGATQNLDDVDQKDGYPFASYPDYPIVKGELGKGYNNSLEETVKIKDFMYSNYTLKGVGYKDINYVKFWYNGNAEYNAKKPRNQQNIDITENNKYEQLFNYKAGDMSQLTMCTYGDYYDQSGVVKYRDRGGTLLEDERLNLGYGNKLVTINDRIIAAFPPALFSEDKIAFDEVRQDMHIVKNYAAPNDDMKGGGNHKDSNKISGKSETDTYKLVDVVIEDTNGQQFIVPFIVIDSKSIHLISGFEGKEKLGNFAHLTDNRYGHVVEEIDEESPVEYDKQYYYQIKSAIIDNITYNTTYIITYNWVPEEDKKKIDISPELQKLFINQEKIRAYYDKDNKRKARYVSAIEPYIAIAKGKDGKAINVNGLNEIITSVICYKGLNTAKPNCKIVSMRIYEEKCADSNGTPITGTWDDRQKEIEENSTIKKNSIPSKYHNDLYEYYQDNQFDKIVGY